MKKLFFLSVAMFFAVAMTGPAFADVNGGVNTYLSATGYDVAMQSTDTSVWAPAFVLDNSQYAVVGALNGMAGVSNYADYTRGSGYAIINTGTDASVDTGWLAGASSDNATVFSVPGVVGLMDNNLDLSAVGGGSADASSNSMVIIIGEDD